MYKMNINNEMDIYKNEVYYFLDFALDFLRDLLELLITLFLGSLDIPREIFDILAIRGCFPRTFVRSLSS